MKKKEKKKINKNRRLMKIDLFKSEAEYVV